MNEKANSGNGEAPGLEPVLCPHCEKQMQDATPIISPLPAGTVLCTFTCEHCHKALGFQITPPNWVMVPEEIEKYIQNLAKMPRVAGAPANVDVDKVLGDLRNRHRQ
jgi:hypothetical protein